MNRVALVDGNRPLFITNENGTQKVQVIEVVGRGGTAIAYKGKRIENGEEKEACIVKEYFPIEENTKAIYFRNKIGDDIQILSENREEELQKQRTNIEREVRTTNELYFDKESMENSPYAYSAEIFCRKGDSTYVVLDTSKGKTLKAHLLSLETQRLELADAILYIEKLLVILEHLLRGCFVHLDIKPENIWLRGEDANESMCLLDFGSVCALKDYQTNLLELTRDEVLEKAKKIIDNEGLGSNSIGYCSYIVRELGEAKRRFFSNGSYKNAKVLLEAMNQISVSDDIYSTLQLLFFATVGCNFTGAGDIDIAYIQKQTGENEMIAQYIYSMMIRNEERGYHHISDIREELGVLKCLLQKEAHPLVLMQNVAERQRREGYLQVSEEILGDINIV